MSRMRDSEPRDTAEAYRNQDVYDDKRIYNEVIVKH